MTQGFVDTRHGCILPMIDDPALFVNEGTRLLKQVAK